MALTLNEVEKFQGALESRLFDIKETPIKTERLVEIIQSGANGIEQEFLIFIGFGQDPDGRLDTNSVSPITYPLFVEGNRNPFANFDNYRLHLQSMVRTHTEGYYEGFFDIQEVCVTGGVVFIVSVNQSKYRPHQNKNKHRYYIRSDGESRPMNDGELNREIIARQERLRFAERNEASEPILGIEPGSVLCDTCDDVFTRSGGILRLSKTPQLYLGVEPTSQCLELTSTQIRNKGTVSLSPLGRWKNADHQRNENGLIMWSMDLTDHNETGSIVQVYKSGRLLAIDAMMFVHEDKTIVPSYALIETLEHHLLNYINYLERVFQCNYPYKITAGVNGVKGAQMAINQKYSEKALSDTVRYSYMLHTNGTPPHEVFLGFYKKLWDEFGLEFQR